MGPEDEGQSFGQRGNFPPGPEGEDAQEGTSEGRGVPGGQVQPLEAGRGGGGRLRAEKTEVEEQDLGTRLHRQRPSFSMDSV